MPGILPMKVIKIGSNAQTRIAQACDRCRSKKIRCDGIRPCCTQCANVGFECKTSDKLSRRAFPRGYTESLEERVRTLEAEVRELKDLLDEKDEKIDVLSKIHSHSSHPIQLPSPRRASESSLEAAQDDSHAYDELDEVFKVKQSPCLQGRGPDSYLAGPSSTRAYIEAFKLKAKDKGFSTNGTGFEKLLASTESHSSNTSLASSLSTLWSAPPRLVSDQLVNIFFQEWAPLFPVLHRPAFLLSYERFVASPNVLQDKGELAQLNLVFAIAALSTNTVIEEIESIEVQWRAALDMITSEHSIETLQALVLAQIYCLRKGDLSSLLTYKGLASTISTRLGLQQAQKSFALDTLSSEVRKKLFWTLYTLDCFSALVLGLPKHIKDDEVFCEYPIDADDEYITENGFQPALPGEATRLSSALALFKATRILSRVLEEVFPAKTSYELSLKTLSDLSDELELWEAALPAHLRLHFAQDKPSTGTVTSRSPILSLVYHYIRALIQRPAVCSKSLGKKASSAMMIHAASCKRIVQIFQLLNERSLSFSFCLNKDEVLLLSGLGLLVQRMELASGPKISKDNQRTIVTIVELLDHSRNSTVAEDFRQLVAAFMPTLELPVPSTGATLPSVKTKRFSKPSISRNSSDQVIPLAQSTNLPASARKHLRAIASRFGSHAQAQRLSTSSIDGLEVLSTGSGHAPLSLSPVPSTNGLSTSPLSDASLHLSLSHSPPDSAISRLSGEVKRHYSLPKMPGKRISVQSTNLDYLSFGNEPEQETLTTDKGLSKPIKTEPQPTDWERLLGNLDNGTTNIFDACYGGPAIEALPPDALAIEYDRRASTASKDAALAWNTGLLSLREEVSRRHIHADDSPGCTTDSSSHLCSERGIGSGSAADLSTVDWTSANSSHRGSSGNDALSALVFGDVGADCDFDLGIDWQEALTTSNDWT